MAMHPCPILPLGFAKLSAAVIACASLLSVSLAAAAAERIAGPVEAEIAEIIDGDSMRVRAHVWPGHVVEVILRLRGIDTPEMRAACPRERALAHAARRTLARIVGTGPVALVNIGGGKYYGRVLADVRLADGGDLAARMLTEAPARAYRGGHRARWCPDEG